jgi:hypothetical protein
MYEMSEMICSTYAEVVSSNDQFTVEYILG